MFDFIRKEEYFEWIDKFSSVRTVYASTSANNLKDIQDHYLLHRLDGSQGLRILEIGGADCRILQTLAETNECWNADKFEGHGAGPAHVIETPGVRNVLTFLGEFSPDLPDDYFDLVFSISVIEHVLSDNVPDMFRDIARCLKPGGRTYHAIDAYLFDPPRFDETQADYTRRRLELYLQVPVLTEGQLQFAEPPRAGSAPGFSCEYASNSDREMLAWNQVVPSLSPTRAIAQSASLKCEWVRF